MKKDKMTRLRNAERNHTMRTNRLLTACHEVLMSFESYSDGIEMPQNRKPMKHYVSSFNDLQNKAWDLDDEVDGFSKSLAAVRAARKAAK